MLLVIINDIKQMLFENCNNRILHCVFAVFLSFIITRKIIYEFYIKLMQL